MLCHRLPSAVVALGLHDGYEVLDSPALQAEQL